MTVELRPIDLNNREDSLLFFDLLVDAPHRFLNDYDKDPALIVHEARLAINNGSMVGRIMIHNGKPAAAVWAEMLRYRRADVGGAALQNDRGFYVVLGFKMFLEELKRAYGIRRFEASVDDDNAPAEIILRHLGFRKEGMRKGVVLRFGENSKTIEFALLADEIGRGRNHFKKKNKVTPLHGIV